MALKYWHAFQDSSSPDLDIPVDFFFRTDDLILSDSALMEKWRTFSRFISDDGSLISSQHIGNLQPAVVADFDTWFSERVVA